jgi:copper chaperone CopZ
VKPRPTAGKKYKEKSMPEIKVDGMHCGNCQKAVLQALNALDGIKGVRVDLEEGKASWEDKDPARPLPLDKVKACIRATGFEA